MPDKTNVYKEATKEVDDKSKKSPHETLLAIKEGLKEMLKQVEAMLARDYDWEKKSEHDIVHQQIDDARWRH